MAVLTEETALTAQKWVSGLRNPKYTRGTGCMRYYGMGVQCHFPNKVCPCGHTFTSHDREGGCLHKDCDDCDAPREFGS